MPDIAAAYPIPTRVRTARKQHACSEYLCRVPIMPGEKYEYTAWPPRRCEGMEEADHWLTWRSHYPRVARGSYQYGCEEAAAYAEKQRREQIND